jgi:hypothetical protein
MPPGHTHEQQEQTEMTRKNICHLFVVRKIDGLHNHAANNVTRGNAAE